MIGWYVHHHGSGHLQRLRAVRPALDLPLTVLSTLPRPADWTGPWVELERDVEEHSDTRRAVEDPTAGGVLHWAPIGHGGLRRRMATISDWIASTSPALMVCDVSVEVAMLARLHGLPFVYVAMPGDRSDTAHQWAYRAASALVGCWPTHVRGLVQFSDDDIHHRILPVGGLSRHEVAAARRRRPGPPRVTLLMGSGGSEVSPAQLEQARADTPGWRWAVLDHKLGTWLDDPGPALRSADVVITHAGENAVADVAAARRPAVVIPARRPHSEQRFSARALEDGAWPVLVRWGWPHTGWPDLLDRAARLDTTGWESWCDGRAARRFAEVVAATVARIGDPR